MKVRLRNLILVEEGCIYKYFDMKVATSDRLTQ